MGLEIITNNHPRLLLCWHDLTKAERESFDYLDTDESREFASFFRYRGAAYDLGEFMRCPSGAEFKGWDAYSADSFYSGILIRLGKDCYNGDSVIVARYFS